MRLYLVSVGDKIHATCLTRKAALEEAERLRQKYWPEIVVRVVKTGEERVIRRMAEVPEND